MEYRLRSLWCRQRYSSVSITSLDDGSAKGRNSFWNFIRYYLESRTKQYRRKNQLKSEGIPFRVFIIDRESPQAVIRGLSELTGTMPMIPRWALGYQQCRFSYSPDSRVIEIADTFRLKEYHVMLSGWTLIIWTDTASLPLIRKVFRILKR